MYGRKRAVHGGHTAGGRRAAGAPARVYDQVNLEVKDFGFKNSFPFTVSAHLPADGTVNLSGNAGPINQQDASATPFSGHLEMKHIDPLAAGFVDASDGRHGPGEQHGIGCQLEWAADACDQVAGG